LVPSPDGQLLYTAAGIYTSQIKPLSGPEGDRRPMDKPVLPAIAGNYYIQLEPKGDRVGRGRVQTPATVHFYFPGAEGPFARLDSVEGVNQENISYGTSQDSITHDKRVWFIAAAQLLVTIPATNDRLILYRFNPDEALAKSDIDYLFVTSQPKLTG